MTREKALKVAKPILFNTEMVRAILSGRKTVTRRIIKRDIESILNSPYHKEHPEVEDKTIIEKLCIPSYAAGDILYVRETWCDDRQFTHEDTPGKYFYKASESNNFKWRPSIHMPKEAARIFLRVKDVRVERLQDITSVGAWKEGVGENCIGLSACGGGCDTCRANTDNHIFMFNALWNSTIKKQDLDKYGWNANPWVWVIEFERIEVE